MESFDREYGLKENVNTAQAISNENKLKKIIIDYAEDKSTALINIFDYLDSLTNKNEKIKEIVDFIKKIGPDAAREYFSAINYTGLVEELSSEMVIVFAKSIGRDAA
jgi:hypothetical protein